MDGNMMRHDLSVCPRPLATVRGPGISTLANLGQGDSRRRATPLPGWLINCRGVFGAMIHPAASPGEPAWEESQQRRQPKWVGDTKPFMILSFEDLRSPCQVSSMEFFLLCDQQISLSSLSQTGVWFLSPARENTLTAQGGFGNNGTKNPCVLRGTCASRVLSTSCWRTWVLGSPCGVGVRAREKFVEN